MIARLISGDRADPKERAFENGRTQKGGRHCNARFERTAGKVGQIGQNWEMFERGEGRSKSNDSPETADNARAIAAMAAGGN